MHFIYLKSVFPPLQCSLVILPPLPLRLGLRGRTSHQLQFLNFPPAFPVDCIALQACRHQWLQYITSFGHRMHTCLHMCKLCACVGAYAIMCTRSHGILHVGLRYHPTDEPPGGQTARASRVQTCLTDTNPYAKLTHIDDGIRESLV